jgi:hypothetical protein
MHMYMYEQVYVCDSMLFVVGQTLTLWGNRSALVNSYMYTLHSIVRCLLAAATSMNKQSRHEVTAYIRRYLYMYRVKVLQRNHPGRAETIFHLIVKREPRAEMWTSQENVWRSFRCKEQTRRLLPSGSYQSNAVVQDSTCI